MATANIYGFPNAKAHSPRNAFDTSFDTLFNSPAGLLLPAYVEDVKAGDKLKLSCKNFTRTRAVNTAAYMSFSEKVDFYFVPYRLLWSAYNQWRLGNTQARSSTDLHDISRLVRHPYARWKNFLFTAENGSTRLVFNTYGTGLFGMGYFSNAVRLLDLLGYGLFPVPNITMINELTADTPSYDDIQTSLVKHIESMDKNFLFNYFRLAAFQCIYMYAYRNEDYEPLDSSFYNADSLFISKSTYSSGKFAPNIPPMSNPVGDYTEGQSTPFSLDGTYLSVPETPNLNRNRLTFYKLFTPRFKNWRKDLYTSLKPKSGILSYYTTTGLFPSTEVVIPPVNEFFPGAPNDTSDTFPTESDYQEYQPKIADLITPSMVRNLFALDKFARLAIYADKNYSSLYEALFGVKVDEPDVPRYLGTFSSDIKISEVVATSAGSDGTADASTSVLGELAGKGIGTSESRVFDAEFKEDGVVMGIHYIMPFNYYTPYKYNAFTVKTSRYDYYYPSFDGLGLSPVYIGERGYWSGSGHSADYYSTLLGFNTRYHEYKQRVNDVHGTFGLHQPDSHWTVVANNYSTSNPAYISKIAPNVTDTIFGVNWDGSMATDPFMCFYSFNVTKVSDMEAIGIPNT